MNQATLGRIWLVTGLIGGVYLLWHLFSTMTDPEVGIGTGIFSPVWFMIAAVGPAIWFAGAYAGWRLLKVKKIRYIYINSLCIFGTVYFLFFAYAAYGLQYLGDLENIIVLAMALLVFINTLILMGIAREKDRQAS